jgi:hypothetical protein
MTDLVEVGPSLRIVENGISSRRNGGLAGFHDLLELREIFVNLLPRRGAQQPGHGVGQLGGVGVVFQRDAHFGAAVAGLLAEMHRAGRIHVAVIDRTPGDFPFAMPIGL